MKFTNVTRAGLYFTCCHREVEPGGSFEVPWLAAREDRAVRRAMADGSVAWEPRGDEPRIPGSPKAPTAAQKAAMARARKEAESEASRRQAEQVRARMAADEEAVKRNMANMGRFDVPGPIPRRQPSRAVASEKPVTSADIISDGSPRSLAEAMRHNRAVKLMHEHGDGGVEAGKAGEQGKSTKDGD